MSVALSLADPAQEAREILSERRFHESSPPRPFKSLFERLGDRFGDAFDAVADVLPGGDATVWTLLALAVGAAAAAIAAREARRRAPAARALPAAAGPGAPSPHDLERRAATAEREGDHAAAVRLRFRAGLLRLGEARAIEWRPSLTTADVRRRLRSERFDAVATVHDAVAYGGRPAAADESAQARAQWPEIVEDAARTVRAGERT